MKLVRWLFISAASLLLLGVGALFLLQSRWMKEQLSHIVQEIALQSGVQLTLEKIEGELPLKWTITGLHATLEGGETVDIDKLQVRFSILPLLKGRIGVSYLHAGRTEIAYLPSSGSPFSIKKIKPSFSIRSASFDEIVLKNQKTDEQEIYNLQGRCRLSQGGRQFFVEGTVQSSGFDATLYCEADKKLDYVQTSLDLTVRNQDAFTPFYKIPEPVAFEIKGRSQGPWKTWKAAILGNDRTKLPPITGNIAINVQESPLDRFQLTTKFALHPNRSWELSHLDFASPYATLQGMAKVNPNGEPTTIEASIHLPDFSYLSPLIKGKADGQITLKDEKGYLLLNSPALTLNNTTFTENKVEVQAQVQKDMWSASLAIESHHPELGTTATSQLIWHPQMLFEVKSFDLISKIGRLSGDIALRNLKEMQGGLSFQITDLSPLSELVKMPLAGQIGGEIAFEGDEIALHSIGKNFRAGEILSNHFDLDITHVKLGMPLSGTVQITSDEAYLERLHLNSLKYTMGWNTQSYDYQLEATGEWKGAFDISTRGTLDFNHEKFELTCSELTGQLLGKQIRLSQPFDFEISKEAFKIQTVDLSINEGHLTLTSYYNADSALLQMSASHFPLDFLTIFSPRFSLQGISSVDIDLTGSKEELTGHANIILEHADIYPAGNAKPIQTKGIFQANLANSKMQLHTHLIASEEQLCDISLSLPINFLLKPLALTIPENLPISGQCTIEGHTEQLFDFINLGSQRVGGFISCHLLLSGTLDHINLHGPLSVQGGFYENYFVGIAIKEAAITAHASGSDLIVDKIIATDGEQGTADASGVIHLTRGVPFESAGTINHFRIIRFDWLTGACTGPFTLNGDTSGALAKGTFTLDEADVTIPDQLPTELPTLPITFINEPDDHLKKFNYSEDYPFRYDLEIRGDHDIRLSGRGIEAELEGDFHMTGENLAVLATGALKTKKGSFSFAGKTFVINQGEILFSGDKSFLNITSSVEYPGLAITVYFRGDLRAPQLIFESNPSLPTSSILARILFNKEVSELSKGQAVQLASTIVTLSGNSGPNVLETIRRSLGVDRFSISSNEETGEFAVQIGKYITKGVMISLIQGTETSHVKVEVELKMGFVLEAETQEEDQGKFSFKWNKNY